MDFRSAAALAPQAGLAYAHLLSGQADHSALGAVAANLPARLALVARAGHLLGRQLQHRLQGGPSQHLHELLHRQLGAGDQLHHRQQELPVPDQVLAQSSTVFSVGNLINWGHGDSLLSAFLPGPNLSGLGPREPPFSSQLSTTRGDSLRHQQGLPPRYQVPVPGGAYHLRIPL